MSTYKKLFQTAAFCYPSQVKWTQE